MSMLFGDAALTQAVAQLQQLQQQVAGYQRAGNASAAAQAQQAIYELNNTISQRLGVLGGPQTLSGKVLVQDAGEVALTLDFPVVFIEEPHMGFGGVMDVGQAPVVSNFPTVSAVILRWKTYNSGPLTQYIGATIGIVTTGDKDHRMWVHWSLDGRGVTRDNGPTITQQSTQVAG